MGWAPGRSAIWMMRSPRSVSITSKPLFSISWARCTSFETLVLLLTSNLSSPISSMTMLTASSASNALRTRKPAASMLVTASMMSWGSRRVSSRTLCSLSFRASRSFIRS